MNTNIDSIQHINVVSFDRFARGNLKFEIKDFQMDWFDFLKNNKYTLLLTPRGSGKSTSGMSYLTNKCLTESNYRMMLVSNIENLAVNCGFSILNYFNNNKINKINGNLNINHYGHKEFRFKNIDSSKKENIIDCIGVGEELNNCFDCIICDDIVDNVNSGIKNERKKLSNWFFRNLISSLKPNGELHVIGTRYHSDDLYKEIACTPPYTTKIYQSESKEGELLWSEKINKQFLNLKKDQMGNNLYNLQYLNLAS